MIRSLVCLSLLAAAALAIPVFEANAETSASSAKLINGRPPPRDALQPRTALQASLSYARSPVICRQMISRSRRSTVKAEAGLLATTSFSPVRLVRGWGSPLRSSRSTMHNSTSPTCILLEHAYVLRRWLDGQAFPGVTRTEAKKYLGAIITNEPYVAIVLYAA